MLKIFLDFETFYAEDYSLGGKNAITSIEYILDPRYETIMCAIAIEDEPSFILERDDVANFLQDIKQPYACASHNATFDMAILAFRYGIHPDVIIDTLSMARALLSNQLRSLRLADLLTHFGLEAKGSTIKDVKGLRYADIKANDFLWNSFTRYCLRDCNGLREIYWRLIPKMTAREMRVIDTVIRMVTQPRLQLNLGKLEDYHKVVYQHKEDLIAPLGVTRSELQSNPQFAQLLRNLNIDPPLKLSNRTGELTYAFAKTDQEFMDLQEHPSEQVQQLMEARLGIKTTIEETRTKRFINIASSTIRSWSTAFLPVPLKYSGAHTHRLSGDWKLNLQNLSSRKQKTLREAIEAPPGYMIIAVDAKQIEARLTAWLARQMNLLDAFREERDIYLEFAALIYYKLLREISRLERFTGKTCILGLGFGMSYVKLLNTLRNAARDQGFDVEYNLNQTEEWVNIYRSTYPYIVDLWRLGQRILFGMLNGKSDGWMIGPCKVDLKTIILPSGLRLYYNDLQHNRETGDFTYMHSGRIKKIYGAKVIENVVQGLDRQYVMDAALRTETRCYKEGIDARIVLQLHDENVYCVPKQHAKRVTIIAHEEMSRPPTWGLDFPAAAEVKAGWNYGNLIELKIPKQVSDNQKQIEHV